MRITESENPDIVFICLSPKEAKQLTKQLINYVGEHTNPTLVIHKITNQMADLFLESYHGEKNE